MKSIKTFLQFLSLVTLSIIIAQQSYSQWSEDAKSIWNTSTGKNVGIGTNAPETKLHITDGSQSIKFLTGTNSSGYTLSIGTNDDGVNFSNNSTIRGYNFSNASRTLLNITSTGNVGIRTTTPKAALDVQADIRSGQIGTIMGIMPEGNNVGDGTFLGVVGYGTQLADYNGKAFSIEHHFYGNTNSSINFYRGNTSSNGFMAFNTNNNTEQMRIDGNGNVGIGTTVPKEKLAVSGKIRVEDDNNIYNNYLYGIMGSANFRSGQIMESSGSMNFGLTGGNAYGFVFRWLSSNNSVPNYLDDNTEIMRLTKDGKLGIGTTAPTEKLTVNGNIRTKKVIVTQTGWADYVFDKNYKLMSLNNLSTYIEKNKHLPEVPSTKEIENNGVDVGTNQALLLKKIEELTLYIIEQQKQLTEQNQQMQVLTQTVEELKGRIKN